MYINNNNNTTICEKFDDRACANNLAAVFADCAIFSDRARVDNNIAGGRGDVVLASAGARENNIITKSTNTQQKPDPATGRRSSATRNNARPYTGFAPVVLLQRARDNFVDR